MRLRMRARIRRSARPHFEGREYERFRRARAFNNRAVSARFHDWLKANPPQSCDNPLRIVLQDILPMPTFVLIVLLAAVGGVAAVTQQVFNANLRYALNSAAWAGVVSYAVGLACVVALALASGDPLPSFAVARGTSWYLWTGGALGAFFIIMAIFLVPKLGAATFIALFVVGQMLASLVLDHFGLFGLEKHAASPVRLAGAALLVAGVVLIRR
jgi:transporter family-2 protein